MTKAIRFYIVLSCIYIAKTASCQTLIGIVKDDIGIPVFAANIYLNSDPQSGCISDFEGNFQLLISSPKESDTLICSFIGMKTYRLPVQDLPKTNPLHITMHYLSSELSTVVVEANRPISEQFAITRMDMIDDVYTNPIAQADPLKAIAILPASTTTDETANIVLRGSDANRSTVLLNEVPISNPVRASNLSNQGFFSLFNPEVIKSQYVYASNPPLIYGNTSGGLVEIQTKESAPDDSRLSLGLSNMGGLLARSNKRQTRLFQGYGNIQYSPAFVAIQRDKLPDITSFLTVDAGVNFFFKVSPCISFNTYNYYLNETFNGISHSFNYRGTTHSERIRMITVNNLRFRSPSNKLLLSLNNGVSIDERSIRFGNILTNDDLDEVFNSVNLKWFSLPQLTIQTGINHQRQNLSYRDSISSNFYGVRPEDPANFVTGSILNEFLETFIFTNWVMNDQYNFSFGARWNPGLLGSDNYSSSQISLRYKSKKKYSALLSVGKYHNYQTTNPFVRDFSLLSSRQSALDVDWKSEKNEYKFAVYYKNEKGSQFTEELFLPVEKTNTVGLELLVRHQLDKFLLFSFSNSFIRQKQLISGKFYPGNNDLTYLAKVTSQYNNPELFTASLVYVARPGRWYTPIIGSVFRENLNSYDPVFSQELFVSQYSSYNRVDLSLSKFIPLGSGNAIFFVSINNIFNQKNERKIQYNQDYTTSFFDLYSLRTIYFGAVWDLQ